MHQVSRLGWLFRCEGRRRERAFDLQSAPFAARLLRLEHNFQDVPRVFGAYERARALPNALDEMAQSVGPMPVGVGLFEELPRAHGVLPQLVAVRVPIIAEHLNGAGRAIDLERGISMLLNGEAAGDHGERGV